MTDLPKSFVPSFADGYSIPYLISTITSLQSDLAERDKRIAELVEALRLFTEADWYDK